MNMPTIAEHPSLKPHDELLADIAKQLTAIRGEIRTSEVALMQPLPNLEPEAIARGEGDDLEGRESQRVQHQRLQRREQALMGAERQAQSNLAKAKDRAREALRPEALAIMMPAVTQLLDAARQLAEANRQMNALRWTADRNDLRISHLVPCFAFAGTDDGEMGGYLGTWIKEAELLRKNIEYRLQHELVAQEPSHAI